MCGIFGLVATKESGWDKKKIKSVIDNLFRLSESRGKEASGVAFLSGGKIKVYKKPISASRLIRSKEYADLFAAEKDGSYPLAVIGHARLVTNGSMEDNDNNQPVVKEGIVGIHNGIIVNDADIWRQFPELQRDSQVDTEALLALVRLFIKRGESLAGAVRKTFQAIKGSASIALFFNDAKHLLLATNTGSLYICHRPQSRLLIFASERYILESLIKSRELKSLFSVDDISQVAPGSGQLVSLDDLIKNEFSLNSQTENDLIVKTESSPIFSIDNKYAATKKSVAVNPDLLAVVDLKKFDPDFSAIKAIRRCTKCILPETMPFIEFDENGVCNYCRNYKKMEIAGEEKLLANIDTFRKPSGPDCLIALSGGRDSSYALHYAKNVLKLNPIAYSYDWGMITDLGRRNQARMCGQLGVEHVLVSADIRKKRENIRKNVLAWLRQPDLGTIPLFMAGDKQYFYYLNKLKKQLNINLVIYAENPLEKTNFKFGFCGVKPYFDSRHGYDFDFSHKIKLLFYYFKQYLKNPFYINTSLIDTVGAYFSSYFAAHDYLYLFNYIKWEEQAVAPVLIDNYDWELAADTKTTWRIGDGTAPFYNYIYYLVAGFTENDTFRSNQIREGMISREEALQLAERDNQPRYESLKWYCDTVGLDWEKTLGIIQAIPKLYKVR